MSRLTITRDNVAEVVTSISTLVSKQVLVGIPESTTDRSEGRITNAALGYIHEFGSPAANIPARPFLRPGVKKATPEALVQLRAAVQAALVGNKAKVDQSLNGAGLIAASGAKQEISSGDFAPLSPSTIRNRHRARQTASMRPSEEEYLGLVNGGMSPGEAQEATGIRPLINTGALRNSLTYVVRTKK